MLMAPPQRHVAETVCAPRGTTSPQTPDEWMRESGEATDRMTTDELLREVEADTCAWAPGQAPGAGCGDPGELPWSGAEELLTVSPPQARPRRPLLDLAAPARDAATAGEGPGAADEEAQAAVLAALVAAALAATVALDWGYFGPRRRSVRGLLEGAPEGPVAAALAAAWPMAEGQRVPVLLLALVLAAYSVQMLDGGVCAFGAVAGTAALACGQVSRRLRQGGGCSKKLHV
ncbi:unnamed protein product [Prorocentrum cordatum]|uniref:Uncharacterized protein n=1 Tax=Prorocentrum cordatum TaxID=2364126 RepID=A0ABN9TB30_9DINO|nr:unnamed protein product [Polarella glacialis]